MAVTQDDVHARLNATVLLARIHLSQGAPDRALEVTEIDVDRLPGPSMQGDFVAIRALAHLACGDSAKGVELAQEAESWTDHVDVRVACAFVRAIEAVQKRTEKAGLDAATEAFALTRSSEAYDGFVLAYRTYPPLLKVLSRLDDRAAAACRKRVLSLDRRLAERAGLVRRSAPELGPGALTPREQEILKLLRQGRSNREIATTLWITESTAKVHVRNVFRKLGVRTRAEAAAAANDMDITASSP
jgi:DNA-binding CsgD family transcriptional regulator